MSLLPASADLKARVARLKLCNCKSNVWADPHLTIELDHILVQRGEATAISYVWGEFDRRDVLIGHPPGKSDDIIRMNLGMEWVIQDVIHCLAEIAADKPIWMDQLCIPQNDKEIRKVLASIATIYRTFDVAVLMPGHPCACLPRIVKELEARVTEEGKYRTFDGDDAPGQSGSNSCLHVCPMSSWMSRLWTFQELSFSQSIRCAWVSKEVAKCIDGNRILEGEMPSPKDLQPYLALLFRRTVFRCLGNGQLLAEEWTWGHISSISFEFLSQIKSEIRGFDELARDDKLAVKLSPWIESIGAYACLTLYRFLSGEVIQRVKSPFMEFFPNFGLFERIPLLLRKTRTEGSRKATHARDYVIAVFAEFPGYSPPLNYKNEEVPMLLQHALDWHRRESLNFVIFSAAPQGLFMRDAAESFLWRPAFYLSPDRIRSADDVYQTLGLSAVPLKKAGACDVVPLSHQFRGCIPFSVTAKSWEFFYGDFADPDSVLGVAAQLQNTIQGWESRVRVSTATNYDEEPLTNAFFEGMAKETLQRRDLCRVLLRNEDIQKADVNRPFNMAQLHAALYELVCRVLYLDAAFCQEKGVKLMFSPPTEYRQYTRVGLCRGDVKLGGEQEHGSDHITAHQSLTVDSGSILFEAEKIDDHEGKPAYRVFGIWVRMEDDFKDDIGAVYDDENPEAFLL